MTVDNETLARTVQEIDQYLAGAAVVVFPAVFVEPDVCWPDNDWRAFLEVGEKAGTRLVYLEHTNLPLDTRDRAVAMMSDLEPDEQLAVERASSWTGPVRVEVGFVADGMRHLWAVEAEWLDQFTTTVQAHRLARIARSADDQADHNYVSHEERAANREKEADKLVPTVTAWLEQLSVASSVLGAANRPARLAAARNLIPELSTWTSRVMWDDPVGLARRDAVFDVQRRLDEAVATAKDNLITAAREHLTDWAEDLAGTGDFLAATTADMRRRAATGYVTGQLGFPSTDLRDRLLIALAK